ncbi:hypothetical protein CC1G_14711 [Coprinopsis cinerea okayama7|uniref:Uncharacterized protein n=1 Tax=Coprinopsis cinerea (strain Okayama-7 / 130 / ATCC MYA-4618 / FGSC 9003) TaxID=240176 RepID=D6RMT6_COPC7|nr:hypothetical protein CC1G_14711 [Coprinopsis cinerea okayama7\|eukprot:XP_002911282.1 hypothetical protein CC1G_14711 [Coprinopsis cinerea okayama7\
MNHLDSGILFADGAGPQSTMENDLWVAWSSQLWIEGRFQRPSNDPSSPQNALAAFNHQRSVDPTQDPVPITLLALPVSYATRRAI